jgi:hypothetical protein
MRLAGGVEMSEFRHGRAPSEGAYHSSVVEWAGLITITLCPLS